MSFPDFRYSTRCVEWTRYWRLIWRREYFKHWKTPFTPISEHFAGPQPLLICTRNAVLFSQIDEIVSVLVLCTLMVVCGELDPSAQCTQPILPGCLCKHRRKLLERFDDVIQTIPLLVKFKLNEAHLILKDRFSAFFEKNAWCLRYCKIKKKTNKNPNNRRGAFLFRIDTSHLVITSCTSTLTSLQSLVHDLDQNFPRNNLRLMNKIWINQWMIL